MRRPARQPRLTPATQRQRIAQVVSEVFGLEALRPGQHEVIEAVLGGRHTLAIMPTGAGKSLCYQVPAMIRPGMTVVISPLIALMQDQYEKVSGLGLSAVQIHSAVPAADVRDAHARIGRGEIEFVFTTPEQLVGGDLRHTLSTTKVDLLVIDEAHCITQWGHDFRPAYLEALTAMRTLGTPTVLALTATAPPEVVADITRQLDVGPLNIVNTGAHRPNLSFRVLPASNEGDKQRQLVEELRRSEGATIVYAATVRHVEQVFTLLRQEGLAAVRYHGRLAARERLAAQDAFMNGGADLIVATNAFGMGIDRSDIRAVIHYDLPSSLDVYSQESGRAGRDGEPARCTLLFQRADSRVQKFFMAGRYPVGSDFEGVVQALPPDRQGDGMTLADIRASSPTLGQQKVRVVLSALQQAGLVRVRRGGRFVISPRLDLASARAVAAAYEERRARDAARLEQMVVYAQTALCRTKALLAALGEPQEVSCGTCDNCCGTAVRPVAPAEGAVSGFGAERH